VGEGPQGLAITPDGERVYVANFGSNTVTVIDTATDKTVGMPVPVGVAPRGVGIGIIMP
jgi:YVTN family beta-propeller protein